MKKRLLLALLVLCLTISVFSVTVGAEAYSDVSDHWAENAIVRWSNAGILNGEAGRFNPDAPMTRAQLAKVIANLLNLPTAKSAGFSDVNESEWYAPYINSCAAAGIMNGANGMARPNDTVSREECFVILARALEIDPINSNNHMAWPDGKAVSDWAAPYLNAMLSKGLVGGTTNGLEPQATSAAHLLLRFSTVLSAAMRIRTARNSPSVVTALCS